MAGPSLTRDVIEKAPKVLLHEHLDGGLRPQTVLDLAAEVHYDALPTRDPDELRRWFIADTPGSDLVRYLDGFRHTTAVHLLESGVELNVIRGWLGHADISTTNHYAEINTKAKEEALRACDPLGADSGFPRKPVWRDDDALLTWLASL